jgi:DNA-directed RNA polymerase subunit K/omega
MSTTDRSTMKNAFEFVTIASARAKQLMNGCVPRVEGGGKVTEIAKREVNAGAVKKVDESVG